MPDVDQPVFHLATLEQWTDAQARGHVAPPSLATEGFIHCSTASQVPGTIDRHFVGFDELRLLRLDLASFADDLVWEESRPGQVYPHVYRAIRIDEVLEVVPWRRT